MEELVPCIRGNHVFMRWKNRIIAGTFCRSTERWHSHSGQKCLHSNAKCLHLNKSQKLFSVQARTGNKPVTTLFVGLVCGSRACDALFARPARRGRVFFITLITIASVSMEENRHQLPSSPLQVPNAMAMDMTAPTAPPLSPPNLHLTGTLLRYCSRAVVLKAENLIKRSFFSMSSSGSSNF